MVPAFQGDPSIKGGEWALVVVMLLIGTVLLLPTVLLYRRR